MFSRSDDEVTQIRSQNQGFRYEQLEKNTAEVEGRIVVEILPK